MHRRQHQGRPARKPKIKGVRLFLEELESRCLFSVGLSPVGGITFGPDGNLWFPDGAHVGELNPTTGVIQEFNVRDPNFEGQIVSGPDGNLWFSTYSTIEKVNPLTGGVQEYLIPGSMGGMSGGSLAFDKAGFLWFWFVRDAPGYWFGSDTQVYMGRLDPSTGQIDQFPLPQVQQGWRLYGNDTTVGSDGAIWFGDRRFDPSTGTVQEFNMPGGPFALATGPDGDIYFTTGAKSLIGRIDPATGNVQMIGNVGLLKTSNIDIEFGSPIHPPLVIPGPPYLPESAMDSPAYSLVFGPDGIVWTMGAGGIERFDTKTGDFQGYLQNCGAQGMVLDANGNLWFPYFHFPVTYVDYVGPLGQIGEFNPNTGAFQTFDLSTATQPPANGSTGTASAASGTTISATAGINFETAVAFFTPQTPVPTPGSAYQATVDWGDGSNSILVLTVTNNSTYAVIANHTYQSAGTFNIKVTIAPFADGNSLSADPVTIFSTANVAVNNWDFNPFW